MCLIVLALDAHPDWPVVMAANRDEFFARPTQPAQFWPEQPDLLAGRDLEQGGTWMGVTASGRIAAITNFRDGTRPRGSGRRSRGLLVSDFLASNVGVEAFTEALARTADDYDGFNLLLGARGRFVHFSNRSGVTTPLTAGIYGLSNHLLDTPWPKVERAKAALRDALDAPPSALPARLEALLADDARAADHALPDTGVSREWERVLSSVFIQTDAYGTRASTTVTIDRTGSIEFIERSFGAGGAPIDRRAFRLPAKA